jgi:hypothetical protein
MAESTTALKSRIVAQYPFEQRRVYDSRAAPRQVTMWELGSNGFLDNEKVSLV